MGVTSIYGFGGFLSCVTSLAVVVEIFGDRDLRQRPLMHIVGANAVADFGFAFKFTASSLLQLAGLRAANSPGVLCTVSAWFGQFFGLATITWSALYGIHLLACTLFPLTVGRGVVSNVLQRALLHSSLGVSYALTSGFTC